MFKAPWGKVLVLMVFLGILCSLTACGSKKGGYHNKEKGFSIQFPKEWELQEKVMGMEVIALSPQENSTDPFRENINVSIENLPEELSLKEYSRLGGELLEKVMTDLQIFEKGEETLNGQPAQFTVFSHRMGTIKVKVIQYAMVKGKRAYLITNTAGVDQFDSYRKRFEEISKTFRLD